MDIPYKECSLRSTCFYTDFLLMPPDGRMSADKTTLRNKLSFMVNLIADEVPLIITSCPTELQRKASNFNRMQPGKFISKDIKRKRNLVRAQCWPELSVKPFALGNSRSLLSLFQLLLIAGFPSKVIECQLLFQ